jgi:prophage regulatory protein
MSRTTPRRRKPRRRKRKVRFIRLPEVLRHVALGKSRVYALEAEGRFPRRVRLSDRASAWVESEIFDWINARLAERDQGSTA